MLSPVGDSAFSRGPMMADDSFSWLIGGPQGSGVDSAASMMGRACALGGLWVFGKREYHSNIMGLHSYFQIRVADRPIRSHVDRVDLLVTFDEETLARHAGAVAEGGGIIYDPGKTSKELEELRAFRGPTARAVRRRLENGGFEPSIAGLLKEAEARRVRLFPFPYQEVTTQFGRQRPDVSSGRLVRTTNTSAVATSLALLSYDLGLLERAIRAVFASKPEVADLNGALSRHVYGVAQQRFAGGFPRRLEPRHPHGRLFVTGTQAVAIGKLLGGCRFQTYYPITPASDESEYLEAHQSFPVQSSPPSDRGGIVVVQTEDEIAAITMALGAGLAGARAATSTSGPGFSLMAEGLGFAGMNEIPLVVTLYQRAGPSTGLPTRHEQGDLWFALRAGHGEFPRIVLASGDAEECIQDSVRCLNYAARYQMPVIHLVDKALANSNALVSTPETERYRVDLGKLAPGAGTSEGYVPYRRFAAADDGISPCAPLGTPGTVSWHTGDEHDELGHIDEDPESRRQMMEKRAAKLTTAAREIPSQDKCTYTGPSNAEAVVVGWGSTKGAIVDALETLRSAGRSLGFLQLRLLNPFPTAEVVASLGRAPRKIAVEMNYSGQLSGLIAENARIGFDSVVVKFNGRPMSQDEVYEGLLRALDPEPPARLVLTHGA
jgi:2-oxoglutarate/2-oxoacid ferredoxin oxidoreductase subunit alpha